MADTTLTLAQRHARGGRLSSELRRREGLARTISAYEEMVSEGRSPTQADVAEATSVNIRTVKRHWHRIPAIAARSSTSTAPIEAPLVTALVTPPEPAAEDGEVTSAVQDVDWDEPQVIPFHRDISPPGPRRWPTAEEQEALCAAIAAAELVSDEAHEAACQAFLAAMT